MSRLKISQFSHQDAILFQPPPLSPYTSDSSSSSTNKISPVVLLVIIILAIIFFLSGLLHLLIRYLIKRPSLSLSFPHSNAYHSDNTNPNSSDALQRQLQQLFRLHDSGLDQSVIDSLPVFYYKDIVGLKKEGFDCAVCLCEFSSQDKLRLLPLCSHAFHISCIDTWLLSNSTCPLCRGSLVGITSEYSFDGIGFEYYLAELSEGCGGGGGDGDEVGQSFRRKPSLMEEAASDRRVFSVRLGKFRSLNNGGVGGGDGSFRKREQVHGGETSGSSSSNVVDARRCYSLGTYQYVVGESDLLVAAVSDESSSGRAGGSGRNVGGGVKLEKVREVSGNNNGLVVDSGGDIEGKKISRRHRGDSFSVSKIWLWSKKDRFPTSQVSMDGPHHVSVGLPSTNRVHQSLPL